MVDRWCALESWKNPGGNYVLYSDYAELEQRNRKLVEALKYHQEQTRPIARTEQVLKEAE